jgi:WD40 repeat protein
MSDTHWLDPAAERDRRGGADDTPLGGTLQAPAWEEPEEAVQSAAAKPSPKTIASLDGPDIGHTLDPRVLASDEVQRLKTLDLPPESAAGPEFPGAIAVAPPTSDAAPSPGNPGDAAAGTEATFVADGAASPPDPALAATLEYDGPHLPPQPADTAHRDGLFETAHLPTVAPPGGGPTQGPGGSPTRTWSHLVIQPRHLVQFRGAETSSGADYELVSELGRGAMGVVYAARQASINRSVAVKMLAPQLVQEQKHRDQFLAEAVVTGELDHPNIVPIYDLAKNQDGALFYSMKHVKGTPWNQVLATKPLAENIDIWLRVADAIALAHDRGVIHRDLKPENVMLGDYGEVLVMDWGIAVSQEMLADPAIRNSSGLAGTPAYMAPEMAVDGPLHRIGPAADVYLLGALLYEIVTGGPPHVGRDVWTCLHRACRNQIVPTQKTGELVDIARRAMATRPEDRYANVKEFQAAVRGYLSHTESIALAERGGEALRRAERGGDYNDYQQAILAFRESVALWEGNASAHSGLDEAVLACARRTLRTGDYDLGLSVLDRSKPEHLGLVRKLLSRRRLRTGVRWLILLLVAIIIIGSVAAAVAIDLQRREAVSARQSAERSAQEARDAQKVAEKARDEKDKALEDVKRERDAKEEARIKAEQNEQLAVQAQRQEADQRRLAEEARKKEAAQRLLAEEAQKKEADQRRLAEDAEKKEATQRRLAESASYRAKIALAASQIDSNMFNRAKAELAEIEERLRGTPAFQPPPWEFARLRYMLALSTQTLDAGYPVRTVACAPDGETFAIGGEGPQVHIYKRGQAKPLRTITTQAQQVPAVAFVGKGAYLAVAANGVLVGKGGETTFPAELALWDVATGQPVKKWAGDGVHWFVRVTPDASTTGLRLITTSVNRRDELSSQVLAPGAVQIWGAGPTALSLAGHKDAVTDAAVAPDGNTLVSVDRFGHALVWRRQSDGGFQSLRENDTEPFVPHGNQPITCARFSPDGETLATAGGDHRILLWKREDLLDPRKTNAHLAPDRVLTGHAAAVQCLDFSADGKRLVSGSDDSTVRVWDLKSGETVVSLRGHSNAVRAAVFSPQDSEIVISGAMDGDVRLWNVGNYREQLVLRAPPAPDILGAAFAPDGRRVVTAHRKDIQYGAAALWDLRVADNKLLLAEDSPRMLEEGHTLPASYALVSRRAGRDELLTIGVDGHIRIWDLAHGQETRRLPGVSRQLNYGGSQVAVSEDGIWLLAAGSGGFVAKLWHRSQLDSAASSQPRQVLGEHVSYVTAVAISKSSRYLFTGDQSGKGILWKADAQLRGFVRSWTIPPIGVRISAACFLPDESRLLCASAYQIRQFSVASGTEIEAGRLNHSDNVTTLALAADGNTLLTGCTNGTATLWDVRRPEAKTSKLDELAAADRQISAVALAADGSRALDVSAADNTIRLLTVTSDRKLKQTRKLSLPGHRVNSASFANAAGTEIVTVGTVEAKRWEVSGAEPRALQTYGPAGAALAARFSPDGRLVATAHADGVAKLWDTETGVARARLPAAHTGGLRSVAFAADGARMFTAGADGVVQAWETATGKLIGKFATHQGGQAFQAIDASPDGRCLATGSDDGVAQLWDAQSGKLLYSLKGHTGAVLCVAFSRDARWLITGGADETARIWKAATGQPLAQLRGHSQRVTTAAFSADGRRAVTGSADDTAKLWAIRVPAAAAGDTAEIESVEEVLTMRRHRRELTGAAFSPDGRMLLTASRDGDAILWPSAPAGPSP